MNLKDLILEQYIQEAIRTFNMGKYPQYIKDIMNSSIAHKLIRLFYMNELRRVFNIAQDYYSSIRVHRDNATEYAREFVGVLKDEKNKIF